MTILYCYNALFSIVMTIKFLIPKSHTVEGAISYPFLITIILTLTVFGIGAILLRKRKNHPPVSDQKWYRWLFLSLGTLISLSGFIYFLMCVYTINPHGSKSTILSYGVNSNIIASFIGSFLLYFSSRLNSIQRPNLIRWIVFFISVYLINTIMVSSLILIHSVPIEQKTSFVSLSILVLIGLMPYSLLLLGLTKDFVVIKKENKKLNL